MGIKHIDTRNEIKRVKTCYNCPAKLYAKDGETIKLGFGNSFADKVIVLPSYSLVEKGDYISCAKVLLDIVGSRLYEDFYVTRDIKCYNVSSYDIHDACIINCNTFLNYELSKFIGKKLFVFGNVDLSRIDKNILNTYIVYRLFNPYIMIVGEQVLKNKFINDVKMMMNL